MTVTSNETESCLLTLADTPRRMLTVSQACADERLRTKPEENGWSANDILAHLRACADVWGTCIQAMLEQEHPTLHYVSPRSYIRKTDYPTQSFQPSLAAFTRQRDELLQTLQVLDPVGWSRVATFKESNKLREHSVFSTARRMALHELDHLNQIEALLKDG